MKYREADLEKERFRESNSSQVRTRSYRMTVVNGSCSWWTGVRGATVPA
jgi:hypothetical protein